MSDSDSDDSSSTESVQSEQQEKQNAVKIAERTFVCVGKFKD
jgi:hypothetical protein